MNQHNINNAKDSKQTFESQGGLFCYPGTILLPVARDTVLVLDETKSLYQGAIFWATTILNIRAVTAYHLTNVVLRT